MIVLHARHVRERDCWGGARGERQVRSGARIKERSLGVVRRHQGANNRRNKQSCKSASA